MTGGWKDAPILHGSQKHLQHIYYLTAPRKLLLASYQGCRLEGREREQGVGEQTEIHRVMETKGTLNSLTQSVHRYRGK